MQADTYSSCDMENPCYEIDRYASVANRVKNCVSRDSLASTETSVATVQVIPSNNYCLEYLSSNTSLPYLNSYRLVSN